MYGIAYEISIGIGKTTLANEICLKWASDEECFLSNDYDLVILIRLRTIQEKTLQQAMIETVGSEAAYDELLTKSDGNRCLIILEGLDEISAYWQNNDTMFNGLVKNTVFLSRASILVTSRPHACVYLYMEIKPYVRSIEIVGFNKPQIKECAEQYFKNSVTAEKFMNQMSNNPRISSLCYVPLCLNMVLECFKYNNETLHTTLTELYQLFIISKVDEHIHFKKVLPLGTVLESDQTYFNNLATVLSNVPSVLSTRALETMFLLSKLAYKSYFQWSDQFINPKIIYTIADLAQCNITNLESDACGLLKATNTLFAIGNTAVYTFNHLSVQEYFCALYISLLPEDQQLQLLKDHITHYPDMWPFFAGITKLRSSDVIDHLCTFLLQDKRLEETILIYSDMAVYNVGKNLVVTTALSSFYEAQLTSDVCIHQLVSLFISRHSLSPHNYLSIFYLMSIAPITCLHLRGCNIGDQEVEELMARCRDLIPSLKVMDLSVNNITHNGIENVVTIMKSTTNLRHFSASRNPIRDAVIYLFSLQHLVQLNVSLIGMTEVGTRVLGEDFKSNSSLQSLEISKNDIKDSELTRILNNLPITLVRLAISSCNLTYNGAVSIGKMLRINQTLKHLEISTNSIGDDGISAISDSLHVNTTLIQIVACSCGFYSKGAESVANMLQVNKTLKYLDVSKNQIGDDGTTAVALSILTNATLVQLNISSCDFCKRGAEVIAEVLRVNKTLKCLDISENFIEYDELSTLACSIQANTTLIKLKISDTHYKFKFTNETLKLVNEVHHSGNTMFSNERKHWLGVTCSGGEVDFEGIIACCSNN